MHINQMTKKKMMMIMTKYLSQSSAGRYGKTFNRVFNFISNHFDTYDDDQVIIQIIIYLLQCAIFT